MKSEKCGIYQIKCAPTGKSYIGSSVQIYVRWSQHRRQLRNNLHHTLHLQRAWDKYGEDAFQFIILKECLREELQTYEQQYIDYIKPEFNILLDVSRGLVEFNRARAALITHCPRGHAYDEANTMINQGKRVCRKCNAERVNKVYENETPEQRECRRARAKADYEKNHDVRLAAQRVYMSTRKEEKSEYDKTRRPLHNTQRMARRLNKTPEQRERRLQQKRESYHRNKN